MPQLQLDSLDDPRLDPYRDLPRSKLTRQSGLFIVEGRLLVERLLASRYEVQSVLVDGSRTDLLPSNIAPEIAVYTTPRRMIERLIGYSFHRGILACGVRQPATDLSTALADRGPRLTLVVCVDIVDPTNLGGILRNCAAFGVDTLLLSRHCVDPFSRRVLRISMGAPLRLTIVEPDSLVGELKLLKEGFGVQLVAAVLDENAELLHRAARPPALALLLGNEGLGLPAEISAWCDRRVTIPMQRGTDSLNVAVASGVCLYHFTRVCRDDHSE